MTKNDRDVSCGVPLLFPANMEDSGKWEVVNAKQKKQQKEKKRDEKRKQEKEAQRSAEEAEKQRKAKELDKFFTQYVQAKTVVTSDVFQETMFSALTEVDEKSNSNSKVLMQFFDYS